MQIYDIKQAADYINKPVAFVQKMVKTGVLPSTVKPVSGLEIYQTDLENYLIKQRENKNRLALVHQFCCRVERQNKPSASSLVQTLIKYFAKEQVYYLVSVLSDISDFTKYLAYKDEKRDYYVLKLDDLLSYTTTDKDLLQLYLRHIVSELNTNDKESVVIINNIHKVFMTGYELDHELNTWKKYSKVKLIYSDTKDDYKRFLGTGMELDLVNVDRDKLMNSLSELTHACGAHSEMKDPERCIKSVYKLAEGLESDESKRMELCRKIFINMQTLCVREKKHFDDIKMIDLAEMLG